MPEVKFNKLIEILQSMESALLAFSGGTDSTLLLKALHRAGVRSLAVTASSELIPRREVLAAEKSAGDYGVHHRVLEIEKLPEEVLANSDDRCYHCKLVLFGYLSDIAIREGYQFILDGSNTDDILDFRPGRKAAVECRVRSPLAEAGFSKAEVRECSRRLGLETWDLPSSPCLATRIPYGRRITVEVLRRIERSEDFLRSLGFSQVRVRDHGQVARIETGGDEIMRFLEPKLREQISEGLRPFGYTFVSLDLDGYRSGSMNATLKGRGL